MNNFTTNTYEMKREIVNFSKNISEGVTMVYLILIENVL